MEDLIPFLIVAFVIYRVFRNINPEQWRKFIEQLQEQQRQQQAAGSQQSEQELREMIQQNHPNIDLPKRTIPRVRQADLKNQELFTGDKWRRQLFILALAVGLGYLVYLLVT